MHLIRNVRQKRAGASRIAEFLVVNGLPNMNDRAAFRTVLVDRLEAHEAVRAPAERLGTRFSASICGPKRSIVYTECDASNLVNFTTEMNSFRAAFRPLFVIVIGSATALTGNPICSSLLTCHLHDSFGLVTEYNQNEQSNFVRSFAAGPANREFGTNSALFHQGDVICSSIGQHSTQFATPCNLDLYTSQEFDAVAQYLRASFAGRGGNRTNPMLTCIASLTDLPASSSSDRFESLARIVTRLMAYAVEKRVA